MSQENGEPTALQHARKLARLFDSNFRLPGTSWYFGWDAIIGLIPGAGDLISAAMSLYIVKLATSLNVPKRVRIWMCVNLLVDFVVGSIPLLGDLFDAGFKANIRNVRLIEAHWRRSGQENQKL